MRAERTARDEVTQPEPADLDHYYAWLRSTVTPEMEAAEAAYWDRMAELAALPDATDDEIAEFCEQREDVELPF